MADGRKQKVVKNLTYGVLSQGLTFILSFISRTVFIWGIGVEYLGLNGVFSDVLGMLSMADLGFNIAMSYTYYKPLASNDYDKIAALTHFYKRIYNIIALAVAVIGICLVPFVPYVVNLDRDVPYLEIYYLLGLANTVISYLWVYKTTIITADQNKYILTRITMIISTIKTIVQIISIVFFHNYMVYLIIGTIFVLLQNAISSVITEKRYSFIKKRVLLSKEEKSEIYDNLKSVTVTRFSSILINATDNVIISVVVGTIFVGFYANYLIIQQAITKVFGMFFATITASIGNLVATEDSQKRYRVFICEQMIGFAFSLLFIPVFILTVNDIINIWLGASFCLSRGVPIAMGVNLYLACVLQPLWSYRDATGLYTKTKWIMLICALVNIGFSIWLGIVFGVVGVIASSAIARLSTYVWYEPKLLFRLYFEQSEFLYYKALMGNAGLICILTLVLYKIFENYDSSYLLPLIFKGVIIVASSLIVGTLSYVNTTGGKILMEEIKNTLLKTNKK